MATATTKVNKKMTTKAVKAVKSNNNNAEKYHGLDTKTLVGIYRTMYLSRKIDDKEIQLKGQN
ncbi:MAG: hypothetical protein HC846_00615, partial [Blastocatellia bacterium]|nr:hypothetical protein [Blastocatellia bacterium]